MDNIQNTITQQAPKKSKFRKFAVIFILCLVVGGLINFSKKDTKKEITIAIGWGLFYGSLTSLGLVIFFMIWLSFNFPK